MGKNRRNRMRPMPPKFNRLQGPPSIPLLQFEAKPPSNPIYPDPINRQDINAGNNSFGSINKPPWQKSRGLLPPDWNDKGNNLGWEGRSGLNDNFSIPVDSGNNRDSVDFSQDNFEMTNQINIPSVPDWNAKPAGPLEPKWSGPQGNGKDGPRRFNDDIQPGFGLSQWNDDPPRSWDNGPRRPSESKRDDTLKGPSALIQSDGQSRLSRPNWKDDTKSPSRFDGPRGTLRPNWDVGPGEPSGRNWDGGPRGLMDLKWDDKPSAAPRMNWENDVRGCPPSSSWDNRMNRVMSWNDRAEESYWKDAARGLQGSDWRDGSIRPLEKYRNEEKLMSAEVWMHGQGAPDNDLFQRYRKPHSHNDNNQQPPSLLNEEFMIRLREMENNRDESQFRDQWSNNPNSRKRPRTPEKDVWSRLEAPGNWNVDQRNKRGRISDRPIDRLEEGFPSPREMVLGQGFQRSPAPSSNDLRAKLVRKDKPLKTEDQNIGKEVMICPQFFKQKFSAKELESIKDELISELYKLTDSEEIATVPQLKFMGIKLLNKKRIVVNCHNDVTVKWLLSWCPQGLPFNIRILLPEDPTMLTVIGFIIKGVFKKNAESLKHALKIQNPGLDIAVWRNGIVKLTKRGQAFSFLVDGHTIRFLITNKWELFYEMQKLFVRRIKSNF